MSLHDLKKMQKKKYYNKIVYKCSEASTQNAVRKWSGASTHICLYIQDKVGPKHHCLSPPPLKTLGSPVRV